MAMSSPSGRPSRAAALELASHIGFLLLGGVFAYQGITHVLGYKSLVAFLVTRNFPAPAILLPSGLAVQTIAGLCLALGVMRLYAAVALIVFTIAASLTLLDFWRYSGSERLSLRSGFIINIAVLGGLLIVAGMG